MTRVQVWRGHVARGEPLVHRMCPAHASREAALVSLCDSVVPRQCLSVDASEVVAYFRTNNGHAAQPTVMAISFDQRTLLCGARHPLFNWACDNFWSRGVRARMDMRTSLAPNAFEPCAQDGKVRLMNEVPRHVLVADKKRTRCPIK